MCVGVSFKGIHPLIYQTQNCLGQRKLNSKFAKLLKALHGYISMRGYNLNKQLLWFQQTYYDTSEISSVCAFFAGYNINHGFMSPEFQGMTVRNPSDDYRNYLKANASIVMPKYNWTLCFWWKFGMLADVEGTIISIKTTGSSMWCCILFYLIKMVLDHIWINKALIHLFFVTPDWSKIPNCLCHR